MTLKTLDYKVVRSRKKVEYINLACAFDIETTSTTKVQTGEKVAFMYVWMLGIGHNQPITYGRSWSEFKAKCKELQEEYGLDENRRLPVYVHNLGYEFQFMRSHFNFTEVFAVGDRKPIRALVDEGIEFRDSYILSGYSLAGTAKNLTTYTVDPVGRPLAKMVGDLDYSKVRHHETDLSAEELRYCDNDIHITTAYIQEQIEIYGNVTLIPMTNTGRVRQYVRNQCHQGGVKGEKSSRGHYLKYRKLMGSLTLTPKIYAQLKSGFMGGFTHSNPQHTDQVLSGVTSVDFTSSYPSVMVSEMFPMSKFRKANIKTMERLNDYCDRYAVIFDIKFFNVRTKLTQETYMSESKCFELVKPTISNGRVVSADEMAVTITDVDWEIINQVYEWDSTTFRDMHYAQKAYLPKAIIKSVLDLYQGKTQLKGVEGSEVEYMLSKGMLNSIYGMCVTDIAKDDVVYSEGEWDVEKVSLNDTITEYNESKNRFLYYPWGLWVTAYARRNLWTGIVAMGNDYIYSDTDSLKILNYEKYTHYFEEFNQDIIEKMNDMCDHYGFDRKLLHPKTIDGVVKTLGIWDYEGTYNRFKTLGAKRYLVEEDGRLEITVAGLPKKSGTDYLIEKAKGDLDQVFELFSDQLYIPANKTGKMTHTYLDEPIEVDVIDYQGNHATVEVESSIHLESCEFTLAISAQYKKFLSNLSSGHIYEGNKYV